MPQTVGSYQVGSFLAPVNATTADADVVRGNDNTLRTGLNGHDNDPGVHLQASTLASRPIAGTAGRKWLTTDDMRFWYDDGSNWTEIGYASVASLATYAPLASPTFSGTVTVPGLSNLNTVNAASLVGTATNFTISNTGSTGMTLSSSNGTAQMFFQLGGSLRWLIQAAGHLLPGADGTYDIGNGSVAVRSLYSAGTLNVVIANGTRVLSTKRTGWTTDPTGTLTRTTFVSDSVTLVELAKRVAALIVDLRDHGMIAP